MNIGFIIPTIGIFGSVREMVEISNVLVKRGHDVTISTPDGGPCVWLPCEAKYASFADLPHLSFDVLIGIIDWKPTLYNLLAITRAKVKCFCFMGFTPSKEMAAVLKGEIETESADLRIIRQCIENEYLVLADSSWQLKWIKENDISRKVGVPFGGVNLSMFHPDLSTQKRVGQVKKIGYSGDPRSRKGTGTVLVALDLVEAQEKEFQSSDYWNKRYTQKQMVQFLQEKDIFLDGHRRAGWCNPVAEAMACGVACVCTDIGAVSDFAIHEKTALVVPVDEPTSMAEATIRLLEDDKLRQELINSGLEQIQKYSYELVVPKLEECLESYLG